MIDKSNFEHTNRQVNYVKVMNDKNFITETEYENYSKAIAKNSRIDSVIVPQLSSFISKTNKFDMKNKRLKIKFVDYFFANISKKYIDNKISII
jgi:hypothetical protein